MPANYCITTVLEAAEDFDITTLLNVKTDCSIADGDPAVDIFLQRKIRQASASISQYCNRQFALQRYQDVIRPDQSGLPEGWINQQGAYQVAKLPLVEVVSIKDYQGNTLVAGTDYEVNLETGEIYKLSSAGFPIPWPALRLTVEYWAGWTLPSGDPDGDNLLSITAPDVEDACIRLVKGAYLGKDRDPMLKTDEVAGVGSQTYWIPNSPTGNFPPDVQDILDNYRMLVIA